MGDVRILDTLTTLPIPHERVLSGAAENLDPGSPMMVLGYDREGELYVSSNISGKPDIFYLLELAKQDLLGRENG